MEDEIEGGQKAKPGETLSDKQRAKANEEEEAESPPIKKLDTLVEYDCETVEEIDQQVERLPDAEKEAFNKIMDINRRDIFAHGSKGGLKFVLSHGLVTRKYLEAIKDKDPGYHEIVELRKKSSYASKHTDIGGEGGIYFGHSEPDYDSHDETNPNCYADVMRETSHLYPEEALKISFHVLIKPEMLDGLLEQDRYSRYFVTKEEVTHIDPQLFSAIRISMPNFHILALPLFPEFEDYPDIKEKVLLLNRLAEERGEAMNDGSLGFDLTEIRREIFQLINAKPELSQFVDKFDYFNRYGTSKSQFYQKTGISIPQRKYDPVKTKPARYDNYLLVQKSINIYSDYQSALREAKKPLVPLYSDNGDMLWPLKLPYKLIKEYLPQDTSNVE